jgi:hypothetical protein
MALVAVAKRKEKKSGVRELSRAFVAHTGEIPSRSAEGRIERRGPWRVSQLYDCAALQWPEAGWKIKKGGRAAEG